MTEAIATQGHTGQIEEWFGNTELAIAQHRETARQLQERGERGYLSTHASTIARLLLDVDRVEEAREALRLAEETAAPDDVVSQGEIAAGRARLLAREGDLAAAEQLARRAVDEADKTDYVVIFTATRLALADVLRLANRRGEALQYVNEAADAEERRGNIPYAATMRMVPQTW